METASGRKVVMTEKALADKLSRLQAERKAKLSKASNIRDSMKNLITKGDKTMVCDALYELRVVCDDAKSIHEQLLGFMPSDEQEKHEIWFKAKLLSLNECVRDAEMWVSNNEGNIQETVGAANNEETVGVANNENNAHAYGRVVDDISPNDSVSNVGSKRSSKGSRASGGSSTASARIIAEADKAALIVRATALKERHALEEQEQQLRRKREQLDLEAEIAATNAKLAVLQSSEVSSTGSRSKGAMSSHLEKEKGKSEPVIVLNPLANEYQLGMWKSTQQQQCSINPNKPLDVRPKERGSSFKMASEHHCNMHDHQEIMGNSHQLKGQMTTFQLNKEISQPGITHQFTQPGIAHQFTQPGIAHQFTQPQITHQFTQPQITHQLTQPQITHQFTEPQSTHQFTQPQSGSEGILTIMHRQNEITAALVQQQITRSLPPRDIPVFEGNPLQYRAFMKAFEQGVEDKTGAADCLFYLEQFTRGQPQQLVRSCQHLAPDRGYVVAKNLLQEHFGNQYTIANAYMEKVLAWQSIRAEDVEGFQEYSLFLRGCCNVMGELEYMQELDMPANMRTILAKLPYKMREQWRSTAHGIMERTQQRAHFTDLVAFVERHVKILSDPLFGDIQDPVFAAAGTKTLTRFKSYPGNRVKGNIVATTVTSMTSSERGEEPPAELVKSVRVGCLCCSYSHTLEECKLFNGKGHKEKIQLLREKGVCFACLCDGHMSRECERRLTCKVCGQTHPTVLHIKRQPAAPEQKKQPASFQTCGHTGAGKDGCALPILPVSVKSAKGNYIIQTYAFLDPGSSATFCSEDLMQRLNVTGRGTSFLLSIMGQETVVPAYSITDLEVAGLDGNDFYSLPEVLSQRKMPVTTNNIITTEELDKWSYLSDVHIPHIKANVDLLIGTNAPKLLEPWEVINSHGNGPYAIITVLGWIVNGPLSGSSGALETEFLSATVNRISVRKLEEMLTSQYMHDFNEKAYDKEEMSREDMRFLEIVSHSAKLQDGHYSLKMPFRKEHPTFSNNLSMAKQRLLGLKRRFQRDERFHQEYASFFTDVISNGYAEKVPQHQLDGVEGKVWYTPHHRAPRVIHVYTKNGVGKVGDKVLLAIKGL